MGVQKLCMSRDATIEIVSSSVGGTSPGVDSDDGPARLMRSGGQTDLDTDDYPQVTAHVNVDSPAGTVKELSKNTFVIREEGEQREITSFELIDDALDLVFVFDDTGSMNSEIDGAKAGVTDLTNSVDNRNIDARYALVTFKDDIEVDQRFTTSASNLKSSVDRLTASAGGDVPEANFDAIERALDLDWRSDAQQVIVDITDAPSHYRGDGSSYSDYTFDEVTRDLRKAGVTFISIGPDKENKTDSLKSVASEVGGLWTDIKGVRLSGSKDAPDNFQRVLERISSLVASTYVLTYLSCAPPGEQTPVEITLDHPKYRRVSDTGRVNVLDHHDLHPDCLKDEKLIEEKESTTEAPGVTKLDTDEESDDPPGVTKSDDTPGVSKVDEGTEVVDIALIPDRDTVSKGDQLSLTVRDETGSRVESAEVRAASETAVTDSRGTCKVTLNKVPQETLTVIKEDDEMEYGSDSVTITVEE